MIRHDTMYYNDKNRFGGREAMWWCVLTQTMINARFTLIYVISHGGILPLLIRNFTHTFFVKGSTVYGTVLSNKSNQ